MLRVLTRSSDSGAKTTAKNEKEPPSIRLMSLLQPRRSLVRSRRIIGSDESCLILSCRVFCLTECEATIASHALNSAHFLDCLLEPEKEQCELRKERTEAKEKRGTHTVLVEVGNRECYTFAILVRYGTVVDCTSGGSYSIEEFSKS